MSPICPRRFARECSPSTSIRCCRNSPIGVYACGAGPQHRNPAHFCVGHIEERTPSKKVFPPLFVIRPDPLRYFRCKLLWLPEPHLMRDCQHQSLLYVVVAQRNHPAPPIQKPECLQKPAELLLDETSKAPPLECRRPKQTQSPAVSDTARVRSDRAPPPPRRVDRNRREGRQRAWS